MSVGVTKDYKIKVRILYASHTLGWCSRTNAVFFFSLSFFSRFSQSCLETSSHVICQSTPAGVWVILLPLQLRTHHSGQPPGPAGASPHLPKLPAGAEEASARVVLCD